MQVTAAAINLIKGFEGFEPEFYFDAVGIPTIGFGTTKFRDGTRPQPGDSISETEAEEELFFHVREKVEPDLERIFGDLPLQPNQRDALASFVYNLGGDESKFPTLANLIREGASDEVIARQWVKYSRAGGKRLLGLYRRRLAELLMWNGLPWESARDATFDTGVVGLMKVVRGYDEPDPDIFDPPTEEAPAPAPEPVQPTPPISPVGTKPPSIHTKPLAEVPYKIDPDAGAKPMEESERFAGQFLITLGVMMKAFSGRLTQGSGIVGTAAALFLALLENPVSLALMATACVMVGAGVVWVIGKLTEKQGDKVRDRGRESATQALM